MMVDVHTHQQTHPFAHSCEGGKYILSKQIKYPISRVTTPLPCKDSQGGGFFSVGIHPWDVHADWPAQVEWLRQIVEEDRGAGGTRRIVAIGECGLDKLQGPSMDVQMACFHAQIDVARQWRLPVIVHCVKAWDELISTKNKVQSTKNQVS